MASRAISVTVLFITCLLFCIGVGALVGGVAGGAWWTGKIDTRQEDYLEGLWQVCTRQRDVIDPLLKFEITCKNRDNVFDFPTDADHTNKDKDIILLLLSIGAAVGVICLVMSFCLFCCLKRKRFWKCTSAFTGVLSLLSGLGSFGAVIFAEVQFKIRWNVYEHGWSVMVSWIGAAAMFLGAVMSFILICVAPSDKENRAVTVRGNQNSAYQYQEHGMQMQQKRQVANYR